MLSIKYSILLWHKPLLCCLCTLASVATSQQSTQLNLPTFLSAAFHSPLPTTITDSNFSPTI